MREISTGHPAQTLLEKRIPAVGWFGANRSSLIVSGHGSATHFFFMGFEFPIHYRKEGGPLHPECHTFFLGVSNSVVPAFSHPT